MRTSNPFTSFYLIYFLIFNVIFLRLRMTVNAKDVLNLEIVQDGLNIKWSNDTSIQFVGLNASLKLICDGNSPTTFEFFMDAGNRDASDTFELWTERVDSNNSPTTYRSILKIELYNQPMVTKSISCVSKLDRITLQGRIINDSGTESAFYTVDTLPIDPPPTELPETNDCEIEYLVRPISPTEIEWTCRWNETYTGFTSTWICKRIPECMLVYPRAQKTKSCLKLLGEDEPCPNCVVSSTRVSSIMYCDFDEDDKTEGYVPLVYSVKKLNGLPERYYHWSWKKEELEKMVDFRMIPDPIYTNDYIELQCAVSETYFSRGAKFTLSFKDSKDIKILEGAEDEFIKYLNHRVYTLTLKIKSEVLNSEMINCQVPIWNSTEWTIQSQRMYISNNSRTIENRNFNTGLPKIKILPEKPAVFSTPEHLVLKSTAIHFRLNCSFSQPVKWRFRSDMSYDKGNFKMESGQRWKRLSNASLERAHWYSSLEFERYLPNPLVFICRSLHNPHIQSAVKLETEGTENIVIRVADDVDVQDRMWKSSPSACPQTIKVPGENSFMDRRSFQWYCENSNKVVNRATSELYCSDPLTFCKYYMRKFSKNDSCLERLDPDMLCEDCRTYPPPVEGEYSPRYLHCGEVYQYAFFSINRADMYFKLTDADPDLMMDLNSIPDEIYRHNSVTLRVECEISSFYFGRGAIISLQFESGRIIQFEDSDGDSKYDIDIRELSRTIPSTELELGLLSVICSAPVIINGTWHNTSQEITRVLEPEILKFEGGNLSNIKRLQTGESVSLDCRASGIPKPRTEWTFPIPLPNYIHSADMEAVVEITDVKSYHSGTYKCLVHNRFERIEKRFEIEIYEDLKSTTYLITLGIVAVAVLLSVSLVLLWYIRRYRNIRSLVKFLTDEEVDSFFKGVSPNEEVDAIMPSTCIPYPNDYKIPLEKIVLGQQILGCGEFGIVYKGSIKNSSFPSSLAIKTMKNNTDVGQFKAVLSEIKVMVYLGNHENIAKFFGACTSNIQQGEVYIAIELCVHGNLLKFLRTHRHFFVENYESGQMETAFQNIDDPDYENLSIQLEFCDLVRWSMEIANAMAYLEEKNVIHGDIASRNVLLCSKLTAKISDFGLSRQLANYTSYIKTSQCALPWRWMALESLRDMTFSIHSDVWAYAITIWEIFSLGEIPYPGLNWNVDFVGKLDNGLRLLKPEYASDQIYEEMLNCWLKVPNRRPTFEHLRRFFQLQYE